MKLKLILPMIVLRSVQLQKWVLPAGSYAWIYALAGINDTIVSARPDTLMSSFFIRVLFEKTYSPAIDGSNYYNDTLIKNMNIATGMITDAGTVQLH